MMARGACESPALERDEHALKPDRGLRASGGTTRTGLVTDVATARAVLPSGARRERRAARSHDEREDVLRLGGLDQGVDDRPVRDAQGHVLAGRDAAGDALAVLLNVQRLHLGAEHLPQRESRERGPAWRPCSCRVRR